MAKTPEAFKEEIYERILEHSRTGEKTFFRKFVEGQLPREGLKEYYRHLYHECHHFVRFVSLVHAMADYKDARDFLARNLMDEFGHGKPGKDHPTLAMNIGRALGLSGEEIEAHGLFPEVKAAFGKLQQLGLSSFLEGLTVLVVIEADLPLRHSAMREALTTHYGVDDAVLEYYHEHMANEANPGYGGDEVHVAREVDILAKYARTDEEQQKVRDAIAATFAVRNELVRTLDRNCGARLAA